MSTIREVARLARVSIGTVSNVLSGSVPVSARLRERVLAVVQQLDYQPNHLARSLKIRETKMIGMVIDDIGRPILPQLMRGAEEAALLQDYLLVLLHSDQKLEREQQMLTALRTRRVDGILLAPTGTSHSHLRAIREAKVPIVCLERDVPGLDCVVADHSTGARECVRHLAAGGRRSIAFILGNPDDAAGAERLRGYREGLAESGREFDETLIVGGASSADDGHRAGVSLLARERRPDAILAADAWLAAGLLRAIHEARLRCPDDIAVASFDDPFCCELLRPRVTAATQPSREMGSKAMELLLKRIQEPDRRRACIRLDTFLTVRESTGAGVAASLGVTSVTG